MAPFFEAIFAKYFTYIDQTNKIENTHSKKALANDDKEKILPHLLHHLGRRIPRGHLATCSK
jgi:hypothetical protein